jgi:5-methyltetrahydrofolate--homocysteine methyltransferase
MAQLSEAIAALDKEKVLEIVNADLDSGRDPMELVDEARHGLEVVGAKFEAGEFFLIELMRAAQVFQAAAALLDPKIKEVHGGIESRGKMVIGTVNGDIHDLGKNIVKVLLECKGVEVVDLGVNVPTGKFIEAVRDQQPQVLGLSALLTASVPEMNIICSQLEEAGLRKDLRVICGGGIVGEVREELKADFATVDANEGVKVIEGWLP